MKNENNNALSTLADMQSAAKMIATTFKMTVENVVSLFLIAQAEGLHPMCAMKKYHIIEGKPSMRADAMQAEFQSRGGVIQWVEATEEVATAMFSHPKLYPTPERVSLSFKEAEERGLVQSWDPEKKEWKTKKNWNHHSGAMLRARVISAGVRMVDPGTIAGMYTPEEIEDMPKDAEDVVVHEPGDSPRHHAIRDAVATEQPAEPSPADTLILKPEAARELTRSISKPPGAAPRQTRVDNTPSGGTQVLVAVKEGEPITIQHLLDACRRFMALAGKEAGSKRLAALNTRYNCGKNDKGISVVSLCPADSIPAYLADIEEEISYQQHQGSVNGALAASGAPIL